MILSYGKPFNDKMQEELAKKFKKKRKNRRAIFQNFLSMTIKQRKNTSLFCWYKNTQISEIFIQKT